MEINVNAEMASNFENFDELVGDVALIVEVDEASNALKQGMFNRIAWGLISMLPADQVNFTPKEMISDAHNYFVNFEDALKNKHAITTMPSSYRSAKSVLLKAITNDVELIDEEGELKGKTQLEKDIKATMAPTSDDVSELIATKFNAPQEQADKLFKDLHTIVKANCPKYERQLLDLKADIHDYLDIPF